MAQRLDELFTEEEKASVFEECHSAPFSGHAGRDNTFAPHGYLFAPTVKMMFEVAGRERWTSTYLTLLHGCSLVEDFNNFRLCGSAASHANTKLPAAKYMA